MLEKALTKYRNRAIETPLDAPARIAIFGSWHGDARAPLVSPAARDHTPLGTLMPWRERGVVGSTVVEVDTFFASGAHSLGNCVSE